MIASREKRNAHVSRLDSSLSGPLHLFYQNKTDSLLVILFILNHSLPGRGQIPSVGKTPVVGSM